jgi:hypothetical protein
MYAHYGVFCEDDLEPVLGLPESEAPTEELYLELKHADPERAAELHPKDRRRILRALQICQQQVGTVPC